MDYRKQDMWHVIVSSRNERGVPVHGLRVEGVVDLPRPMAALEAATCALQAAVVNQGPLPARIGVDVWGRTDIGSDSVRHCSAVADYHPALKRYMHYTPWDDESYAEIGTPGDVRIIPFGT